MSPSLPKSDAGLAGPGLSPRPLQPYLAAKPCVDIPIALAERPHDKSPSSDSEVEDTSIQGGSLAREQAMPTLQAFSLYGSVLNLRLAAEAPV